MGLDELVRYAESVSISSDPDPDRLRSRYRGTLLGLAAGNALGLSVEGLSAEEILDRHPGGVRAVPSREIEAPWDDDLAQAVVLGEALLEHCPLDVADFAERLLLWKQENGRGIGAHTAAVIKHLESGVPAELAARQAWEDSGRRAAGNGAVMRSAPVALRCRRDPRLLIQQSAVSAGVTHADPRCIWSTVAFNVALAAALGGNRIEPRAFAAALASAGATPSVVETVQRSGHGFVESLELEGKFMGYTLKALSVGLWAMQRGSDVEETLVAIVGAGGDTDTNGAVAGAMLGACHGEDAIPERWLDHINDIDLVGDLAEQLFDAAS